MMKVPIWAHETASYFWAAVGAPEPFPRALRAPINRGPFDLTIKEMAGLSTFAAEEYLARLGPGWSCGGPDRAVRACLAARDGAGFILLDAKDAPAERVFSLAHELAHFLWHYWRPRERAGACLGVRAVEAFDARRKPTPTERLRSLLSNVPLGPHLHLMDRGPRREMVNERILVVEEEANRLAFELLAPADAVCAAFGKSEGPGGRWKNLETVLEDVFGLPTTQAKEYGQLLLPPSTPDPFVLRFYKTR
jgi:hypothetical protein